MKKDYYRHPKMDQSKKDFYGERKSRIRLLPILIVLVALALIVALVMSWSRWEGKPPVVLLEKDFKALGRNSQLSVTVHDPGSGLKQFSVTLTQKNQTVPLIEEQYAGPTLGKFWQLGDRQTKTFQLGELIASKYKIQDGPAVLKFSAVDHSLRNFFPWQQR